MAKMMDDLHAVGINPFGVQLVAESLLKSPLAPMTADKPVTMFFPVQRSDCAGWAGVRFTFEAVRAPCECQQGTCESKTGRHCRMADEVKPGSGAQ